MPTKDPEKLKAYRERERLKSKERRAKLTPDQRKKAADRQRAYAIANRERIKLVKAVYRKSDAPAAVVARKRNQSKKLDKYANDPEYRAKRLEQTRKYREANVERIKETDRLYALSHKKPTVVKPRQTPEERKKREAEYRRVNADKIRAKTRNRNPLGAAEYRLANSERIREYQRAYEALPEVRVRRNLWRQNLRKKPEEHLKTVERGYRYRSDPQVRERIRVYQASNKEHLLAYYKRRGKETRETLADTYVKKELRRRFDLRAPECTPTLIGIMRAHIKIVRRYRGVNTDATN